MGLETMLSAVQLRLKEESILFEEEKKLINGLYENIDELATQIPLFALQVRDLEERIDRYRSGKIGLDAAFENSALFSNSSELARQLREKYRVFMRSLFDSPDAVAECLYDLSSAMGGTARAQAGTMGKGDEVLRTVMSSLYSAIHHPSVEHRFLQMVIVRDRRPFCVGQQRTD